MIRRAAWSVITGVVLLLVPATVLAADKQTNTNASSLQSVAQAYKASETLRPGFIVQPDTKKQGSVALATYADSKKLFGVVVAPNSAAVSLSSTDPATAAGNQVYVVTSGRYYVLVSNQNGSIGAGDPISVSAISGIGMKADTSQATILGRAVGTFDGKNNVASVAKLKTSKGAEIQAAIGSVQVDIGVAKNPLLVTNSSGVPQFVQKAAISVIGKPINASQLYVSIAIMLAGFGITAALMYGGIQSGMMAIGRNPLAKQSIMRNMIQVVITGLLIFIGCLVAVYLVLKL